MFLNGFLTECVHRFFGTIGSGEVGLVWLVLVWLVSVWLGSIWLGAWLGLCKHADIRLVRPTFAPAPSVSVRAWLTAMRRAVPWGPRAPTRYPTPRTDGHAQLRATVPIGATRPCAFRAPFGVLLLRGTRPSRARGRHFDDATRPTRPILLPRACR